MSTTLIVILFAVGLVALFVLGMSLTLLVKGHHIKSEISQNERLRNAGIKCAAQEVYEEMNGRECDTVFDCGDNNCATCSAHPHEAEGGI